MVVGLLKIEEQARLARAARIKKWAGVAVAVVAAYGLFKFAGPGKFAAPADGRTRYSADDIQGVDFSRLTMGQKKKVMEEANREGCTCGCGMTLAQCIVTDRACPLRSSHTAHLQKRAQEEGG